MLNHQLDKKHCIGLEPKCASHLSWAGDNGVTLNTDSSKDFSATYWLLKQRQVLVFPQTQPHDTPAQVLKSTSPPLNVPSTYPRDP